MAEVKGPIQKISRHEWLLYKAVVALLPDGSILPAFGDYAIASHDLPQIDMRLVKPAATIRYTIDDAWLVAKGNNVRDNGFEQYRGHCGLVAGTAGYMGAGFSEGSAYVDRCKIGKVSTGNLSVWRWVGTNHHMTKVVYDLANFHGL